MKAGAGEGAGPVPAGTVMMSAMPRMVMTRPASRVRFCSAFRRISHNAAAYKVTPAPTATAVTASVVPYTWYITSQTAPATPATDRNHATPASRWMAGSRTWRTMMPTRKKNMAAARTPPWPPRMMSFHRWLIAVTARPGAGSPRRRPLPRSAARCAACPVRPPQPGRRRAAPAAAPSSKTRRSPRPRGRQAQPEKT
jgi:hypothetical protein